MPKHAPPSTTRKEAEDARMQKKKRDNGNHTPSKPSQHLLIYKARTFSANFLSVRAEHAPQRAPDTEIMTVFVRKGVEKKRDRTFTVPIDSRRAVQPTKQKQQIEEPTSCHFFNEVSR